MSSAIEASPARPALADISNLSSANGSRSSEPEKRGGSEDGNLLGRFHGDNGQLLPPPPLIPPCPASSLAAEVQAAIDAQKDVSETSVRTRPLVVVEGAIPLPQLIDDAVNKADESRGRRKATRLRETNASASASVPVSENLPTDKKSWKERSRETDWADPKSIIANFPTLKGMKYGCIQPHPRMFSRITSLAQGTCNNPLLEDDRCRAKACEEAISRDAG